MQEIKKEEIKNKVSNLKERLFLVDIDLPTEGRFASRIPIYITIKDENEKIGNEVIYYLDRELRNELENLNRRVRTEVERHTAKLKFGLYVTTESGVARIARILDDYRNKYRELEEKIAEAIKNRKSEYISRTIEYISQKDGKAAVRGLTDGLKLTVFPLDLKIEEFVEKAVMNVCGEAIASAVDTVINETRKRLDELSEKLKNARYVIHLPTVREAIAKEIQAVQSLAQELGIEIDERINYQIREFYRLSARFADRVVQGMDSGRAAALVKKLSEFNEVKK